MARKHADVIKNVLCIHKTCFATFYDFDVYPISENFPFFFLQLFEAIWKTAANPGTTFTQSCAEKYKGALHFTA